MPCSQIAPCFPDPQLFTLFRSQWSMCHFNQLLHVVVVAVAVAGVLTREAYTFHPRKTLHVPECLLCTHLHTYSPSSNCFNRYEISV